MPSWLHPLACASRFCMTSHLSASLVQHCSRFDRTPTNTPPSSLLALSTHTLVFLSTLQHFCGLPKGYVARYIFNIVHSQLQRTHLSLFDHAPRSTFAGSLIDTTLTISSTSRFHSCHAHALPRLTMLLAPPLRSPSLIRCSIDIQHRAFTAALYLLLSLSLLSLSDHAPCSTFADSLTHLPPARPSTSRFPCRTAHVFPFLTMLLAAPLRNP